MNTPPHKHPKRPLKQTLFDRIESENVSPRSRLYFRSVECFVWALWLFSVVVGALAVAISLFVVAHSQYALYEATHDNFFTFVVDALPYLWIVTFGLMVVVAVFNLRHTKRGYRYPLSYILLSSVILSFAGGSALQFFGLGYQIDHILGQRMAMYMSQEKYERMIWQAPNDGRLIGRQVYTTVAPTTTVIFEDVAGQRWRLDISELMARDLGLLETEKQVRLLGVMTNQTSPTFHACGAFPWLFAPGVTLEARSAARDQFIQRVYHHAEQAKQRLIQTPGDTFASTSLPERSVCAGLAAVRRMPPMATQ